MRLVTSGLAFLFAVAVASSASAFDVSGNYLITVVKAKPTGSNGATLCATVVQDGSTLGFAASGTVSIDGFTGNWFRSSAKGATFEIPLPNGFVTFSGEFGARQIAGTSFIEVTNGAPAIAGSFTATKGGC